MIRTADGYRSQARVAEWQLAAIEADMVIGRKVPRWTCGDDRQEGRATTIM
jgi:hypothetical protein